jgi:hypothetical protein
MEESKMNSEIANYTESVNYNTYNIDVEICIAEHADDASTIHVWMNDTAVTNLTERDAYESVVSQMTMLYKEARFHAERVAEKYKLTIDCECFGVKSGKMYFCFFCHNSK